MPSMFPLPFCFTLSRIFFFHIIKLLMLISFNSRLEIACIGLKFNEWNVFFVTSFHRLWEKWKIRLSNVRIYLVIYRERCKFYRKIWPFITGVERCSLPVEWDGEWHDSSDTERDITFTRSNRYVEGWKHMLNLDTVTSWTCVDQDTSNNLLLFKLIKAFISLHIY